MDREEIERVAERLTTQGTDVASILQSAINGYLEGTWTARETLVVFYAVMSGALSTWEMAVRNVPGLFDMLTYLHMQAHDERNQ